MAPGSSKFAVRSMLRRRGRFGKEATKFQFDIAIRKLHGLHPGPHTVKWTRGGKTAFTRTFHAEKETKETLDVDQKLALLCTLYRSKTATNSSGYGDKDTKLSLISLKDGKVSEKTIGKVHFNLAEYVGVPSCRTPVTFDLNSKFSIDVVISCTFVEFTSDGFGSRSSELTGLSLSSGELDTELEDFSEHENIDRQNMAFSPTTPDSTKHAAWSPKPPKKEFGETDPLETDAGPQDDIAYSPLNPGDTDAKEKADTQMEGIISSPSKSSLLGRHCRPRNERKKTEDRGEITNGLQKRTENFPISLDRATEQNKQQNHIEEDLRSTSPERELNRRFGRQDETIVPRQDFEKTRADLWQVREDLTKSTEEYVSEIAGLRSLIQGLKESKRASDEKVSALKVENEGLKASHFSSKNISSNEEKAKELLEINTQVADLSDKLRFEKEAKRKIEQKCENSNARAELLEEELRLKQEQVGIITDNYDDLCAVHGRLTTEFSGLRSNAENSENEWIETSRKYKDLYSVNGRLQEDCDALRTKVEKQEISHREISEMYKDLQHVHEKLRKECDILQSKAREQDETLKESSGKYAGICKLQEKLELEYSVLQNKLRNEEELRAQLSTKYGNLCLVYEALKTEYDTLQHSFEEKDKMRTDISDKYETLSQNHETLRVEHAALQSKVQEEKETRVRISASHNDLIGIYEQLKAQHEALQTKIDGREKKRADTFKKSFDVDESIQNAEARVKPQLYLPAMEVQKSNSSEDLHETLHEPHDLDHFDTPPREVVVNIKEKHIRSEVQEYSQRLNGSPTNAVGDNERIQKKCPAMEEKSRHELTAAHKISTDTSDLPVSPELTIVEKEALLTLSSSSEFSMLESNSDEDIEGNLEGVRLVFASAIDAQIAIQHLTQELQQAQDKELEYNSAIVSLKAAVDCFIPEFEEAVEQNYIEQENIESQLCDSISKAELARVRSSEESVRRQECTRHMHKLEVQIDELRKKAEVAQELHKTALSACKEEVTVMKNNVKTAGERVSSLQNELSIRRETEANLAAKVKELNIEVQIVRAQAQHETSISKEATRHMEILASEKTAIRTRYEKELTGLQGTIENLRRELQTSAQRSAGDLNIAKSKELEHQKMREEVRQRVRDLEDKLENKEHEIASLQKKLQASAGDNQLLSESAAKDVKEKVATLRERSIMESRLQNRDMIAKQQTNRIEELEGLVGSLENTITELRRSSEEAMSKESHNLSKTKASLAEVIQNEQSCKLKLSELERRMELAQKELQESVQKNAKLSRLHHAKAESLEEFKDEIRAKSSALTKQQFEYREVVAENSSLTQNIYFLQSSVKTLEDEVRSLRIQLSESQNDLAAFKAGSEANVFSHAAELTESERRDEMYKQDIIKKNELIHSLKLKLQTVGQKHEEEVANLSCMAAESQKNIDLRNAELEVSQANYSRLKETLYQTKTDLGLENATIEGDLVEALSREENYKIEMKKLRNEVKNVQKILQQTRTEMVSLEQERARLLLEADIEDRKTTILHSKDSRTTADMRAKRAMAEVIEAGISTNDNTTCQFGSFEKLTDSHVLEMLVETKMKLALVEEEKLQLEDLINRLRKGDKRIEKKVIKLAENMQLGHLKGSSTVRIDLDRNRSFRSDTSEPFGRSDRDKSHARESSNPIFREQPRRDRRKPFVSDFSSSNRSSKEVVRKQPSDKCDFGEDRRDARESSERSPSRRSTTPSEASGVG